MSAGFGFSKMASRNKPGNKHDDHSVEVIIQDFCIILLYLCQFCNNSPAVCVMFDVKIICMFWFGNVLRMDCYNGSASESVSVLRMFVLKPNSMLNHDPLN